MSIELTLFDIDWQTFVTMIAHLLVAFLLGVPLGWERERSERSAGLRTFPLVAIASCAYAMAGINFLSSTDAESRVIQALITGMGFIGGGAILKVQSSVSGTATAAGLWITGAIGMTVALHTLELAVVLSAITFLTFRSLHSALQINKKNDPE